MAQRWWALMLLPLMAACATPRVVRLDTGAGAPLEYTPSSWDASVEVDEDDFEEALTRLALAVPLSIRSSQAGRLVRASSAWGHTADAAWQQGLRGDYGRWCRAREGADDCLSLLEDGLGLGETNRLTLAMGFAVDPMREAVFEAVQETLNPRVFYAVVVTGLATWVALLAAPEPFVTKAAAVMSAVMVVYLGVGPFLSLVRASFQLKQTTDRARTFEELEVAGARFGRVMGKEGTRVAILAFAALLGQGSAGMAASVTARLRMLPAYAEAAALGEAQVGLRLAAVGEVSSIAVVDGTLVLTLPSAAVAMTAMGPGGIPGDPDGKIHHICTDKNEVSDANGGPWAPQYQALFDRAGLSLENPANKVRIRGHEGPHPEAYHLEVYQRIQRALAGCRDTATCRDALTKELGVLSQQLRTQGNRLRRLVTKDRE